ncbi:histone deacetylase 9-B [Clupea harengus]|uniref:histone deacetylase n=1 Tax=Clupea harengus TaxID=7950 RepID=A0A6P8G8F7_CLUHA|nr:histone deacetylase 9-B [Clupea harengus]
MLQTIYEGNLCFSTDSTYQQQQLASQHNMHNVNDSVNMKQEGVLSVEPVSPLDLRTDVRLPGPGPGPEAALWERQLQEELLLIQKQQQLQKQLLISEFQKQHENLLRQHQAQLQEHLKLQQELQTMKQKQKQKLLQKEKQQQEEQNHEREQDGLLHEQQSAPLRSRERYREGAVASTQVKQKLQEFLLSKTPKDALSTGSQPSLSLSLSPKQWYIACHHTSLDPSSPPLGDTLPPSKLILPLSQDGRDDFPLRKTASEPNLKIRSRLKQKVVERRSSPLLKKNEGTIATPFKKRALELLEAAETNPRGSGPGSPNGAHSAIGAENGPSSLPTTTRTERWPSQPRLFGPDGSVSVLSLYTSPSLPNITLGLAASSAISAAPGGGGGGVSSVLRHGLPTQMLGPVPMPVSLESKAGSSQQALLQHLLQKEQIRQQKIISSGQCSASPQCLSPLATKESSLSSSGRPKLPRHHRPLNRTQSVPLPQSTLAQLVIQQQHFLEKQKHYQQQVPFSKLLCQPIEQPRQPSIHLLESEDEQQDKEPREQSMLEERSPSGGVIRKHSRSNGTFFTDQQLKDSHGSPNPAPIHEKIIKVKEEPTDSDEEVPPKQVPTYHPELKGRLVIQAIV